MGKNHVHDYIPYYNPSDLYVYFNSLLDYDGIGAIAQAKADLGWNAMYGLKGISNSFSETSNNISQAINFLSQAANSERNKEINAILQYKQKLNNELKDWINAPALKEIIDKIESINLDNIKNENEYQDLNKQLIRGINLIKQQITSYETQLKQLINENKEQITTAEVYGRQVDYRLQGDIISVFNDFTGLQQKEAKKDEDNIAKIIRQAVSKYVFNNKLQKKFNPEDFFALLAAITSDIEMLAQEEYYAQKAKDPTLKTITSDIYKKVTEKYLQATQDTETNLQKNIRSNNYQLENILEGMKKGLGIKTITSQAEITRRQQISRERILNSSRRQINTSAKKLLRTKTGTNYQESLLQIEWAPKTSQSHGIFREGLQTLIENALVTHGSGATDIISIGSISFNPVVSVNGSQINQYLKEVRNTIDSYVNNVNPEDRFQDYEDYYSSMNDEITNTIKKLENLILPDSNFQQLFVFHESLKLYLNVERGLTNEFHGVEMQILSALDKIYSANGISGLQLPQKDAFKLIALNLSTYALGGEYKATIENFLSIFAGLLMFDDIKNIAIDASNKIMNQSIQQVHLYLVNNMYIPSSVILTNISLALQQSFTNITAKNAAKATINTSNIDASISKYQPNELSIYKNKLWNKYGENARTGTTVQITFLASFINLLQSLI